MVQKFHISCCGMIKKRAPHILSSSARSAKKTQAAKKIRKYWMRIIGFSLGGSLHCRVYRHVRANSTADLGTSGSNHELKTQ
jgi:hypothetical protein